MPRCSFRAYSFPYAAMQIVLGPATDAFAKVRLICISLVGVAIGSPHCAVAPHDHALIGGRIVAGAFEAITGWCWTFAVVAVIAVGSLVVVVFMLRGAEPTVHRPIVRAALANYRAVVASPMALLVFGAVAGEGILLFGFFPFVAPILVEHTGAASTSSSSSRNVNSGSTMGR